MENASLQTALQNITTSSPEYDDMTQYLPSIRDLSLKVIYIVIGTVGVIGNLFVIIVFASFIKITDKVLPILHYFTKKYQIN